MVLAAERDGTDGAFHRVVVEFDATVIEEATKGGPAGEGVTDRIGKAAARREPGELRREPAPHGLHQRQRLDPPDGLPSLGRLSSGGCLDRIELGDASASAATGEPVA